MPTPGDVVAALDDCYDPVSAEPWDAVDLACAAADRLRQRLGDTVETVVHQLATDPWSVQPHP